MAYSPTVVICLCLYRLSLGRSKDCTCIPAFSGPFQQSVCTKYVIVDWMSAWFHPTDSYCNHSTDNAWHPPTIIWESQHVTPQKRPHPVRGILCGEPAWDDCPEPTLRQAVWTKLWGHQAQVLLLPNSKFSTCPGARQLVHWLCRHFW